MKVAIIDPPILGHEGRGTGIYTKELKEALEKYTKVEVVTAEINNLPENIDLYHFPYFDPFFLTLPLFRKSKTIVTVHDLMPLKFPEHFQRGIKGEIKWQIQKFLLKEVETIITDSLSSKQDIISLTGIPENKVHTIYLAAQEIFFRKVAQDQKKAISKKYRLPPQFFLYVGDVNWNKNLPNIISAISKTKTHLVLVSKSFSQRHDKTYHSWKESLIQAQILSRDNSLIHSLGKIPVAELASLYQMSEALLMPSYYEGFGLPVVEAFASNCPVIASKRGSLQEICGNATYFVDPDNLSEIINSIDCLKKDSQKKRELIERGKNQIKNFSWKKTALETVKVYNNVLNVKNY